jgi:hypothetical protein
MRRFDRRKTEESVFVGLMILSLALVVGSLMTIVGGILIKGIP